MTTAGVRASVHHTAVTLLCHGRDCGYFGLLRHTVV